MERRALEVFIAHRWDINEPRSDLDHPLLRYVANNHRGISNLHGAAKL